MNFELSDEQKEFSESFRGFCSKEIGPRSEEFDEKGEVSRDVFRKLGEVGYNGLLHLTKYGGSNAGYMMAILAQEILAEYCGSTFFSVGASSGLFGLPISEFGTEEQKSKYLPPVIRGERVGALGVTEPDAGSDVSAVRSNVKSTGNKLLLNGQKTYITNAPIADYILILANLEDSNQKKKGLTAFIVDASKVGVTKGKPMKKMGLKGSPTGELFFDNVELSENDILGRPGRGFQIIMDAFNRERISLAAYSTGVMAACIAESRAFSRTRKTFGRPIYKHQAVAFMLADMYVKYQAARVVLHETAWMMDEYSIKREDGARHFHNGYPVDLTAKTSTVKLLASTHAREVCNLAVQVHGGAGYMEEYKVARLYRDIKLAEIGGGTSEIQKQIIAHAEAKRIK